MTGGKITGPGLSTRRTDGYGNMTAISKTTFAVHTQPVSIWRRQPCLRQAFANEIPTGALLMISDKPMEEAGVKTEASDREVTRNFAKEHVMLGVEALRQIIDGKKTIRHIRFSW